MRNQLKLWKSCTPLLYYGKEQTGNAGVFKPDVDHDLAEDWKIFLFTQYRSELRIQKIVTTFLASSNLVAGSPNLESLVMHACHCDNWKERKATTNKLMMKHKQLQKFPVNFYKRRPFTSFK